MARDPSHIFLSGASGDFGQVRRDLNATLVRSLCRVTHQDAFPQTATDTLEKLVQLIEPCGMMIHLIGTNPGSIPAEKDQEAFLKIVDRGGAFLAGRPELRNALGDFSTLTYTQWEAYLALHFGIPLLVYADASFKDSDHPQRAHLDRLKDVVRFASDFEDESALHRMVMADLMAHFRLHPATAGIPQALRPSNLPGGYIGRLFVGREDFLKQIRESLIKQSHHATAITQRTAATGISGLGGIGKTHAAIEYAVRHADEYGALLFATADTPEKLRASLSELCGVLRLDEDGSLAKEEALRVQAALDWLASHSGWLLILDNVDDEVAAEAVRNWLGPLKNGHVLITSRLHDWADNVEPLDLEVLTPEAAAELLLELTKRGRRRADDDEVQARKLAELLEGLPLAIHQAAGYIGEQALGFSAYIARYEKEAAELLNWFSDHRIPLERPDKLAPRPVLVTWKTSFQQLGERDRFWLLVFSHFSPEPIPEFLLEPALSAQADWIRELSESSAAVVNAEKYCLLTRSRSEPVFKVHRLVQMITRLQSSPTDQHVSLEQAILLIYRAEIGDPTDIESWLKWIPIQPHAISICSFIQDDEYSQHLSWLEGKIGLLLLERGWPIEAQRHLELALLIERKSPARDNPVIVVRLHNLALACRQNNHLAEAEVLLREALQLALSLHGYEDASMASIMNSLAQVLQETNHQDEAEPLIREALRIHRKINGEVHSSVSSDLNNLANLLLGTDRLAEAELLVREALSIDQALLGDEHPSITIKLSNLASVFESTNRLDEAESLIRKALRIDRLALGDNHPEVAARLNNLAHILIVRRRFQDAEPIIREALRIDQLVFGDDHPKVAIRLNNLAQILQATKRFKAAEAAYRLALSINRAAFGDTHTNVARDLNNLGSLLQAIGRNSDAKIVLKEALRIYLATFGPTHHTSVLISRNLNAVTGGNSGSRTKGRKKR